VTTERILTKEQTAGMGYLRRVNGVTLRGKEHRSEIREAGIPSVLVRPCISRMSQERISN